MNKIYIDDWKVKFVQLLALTLEMFDIWIGSLGIATGYGLDDQGGGSSSPSRVENSHISISCRPALGSTQPPIKWVPGALSRG
jgi:hypothetical protein